ncbi:unnamed protein product [Larinioides sclopetarius]|uniref:Ribosomal protein S14 n=1 Tax=Larinioides sclopetarius TaxID=280406 RepID=A0AAV2AZU5_9ARAC
MTSKKETRQFTKKERRIVRTAATGNRIRAVAKIDPRQHANRLFSMEAPVSSAERGKPSRSLTGIYGVSRKKRVPPAGFFCQKAPSKEINNQRTFFCKKCENYRGSLNGYLNRSFSTQRSFRLMRRPNNPTSSNQAASRFNEFVKEVIYQRGFLRRYRLPRKYTSCPLQRSALWMPLHIAERRGTRIQWVI